MIRMVEGVPYRRHRVRLRMTDGRRRAFVLWSPGAPWVRVEAARTAVDRFGFENIAPGSLTVIEAP